MQKPAEKNITLKTVAMFGGSDPNAKIYQPVIEQFMKNNPNITVEDDSQNSDEEWKAKVAAAFAADNEPDVLASARNTDGIQRAVPTSGIWEGLFCNADMFNQYGLELPTDWKSFETAIKTFRKEGIIPIAVSLNDVPHYWVEYGMLYSSGVEEYTSIPAAAPAGWVKGLETIKMLRDMGAFPKDTDTVDEAYAIQLFNKKEAAMILDGSWRTSGLEDREHTVIMPFPGVADQKTQAGTVISGFTSGFYITRKAWNDPDRRDAAVKFVMAQTGKEVLLKYWGGAGIPACEAKKPEGLLNTALELNTKRSSSAALSIT